MKEFSKMPQKNVNYLRHFVIKKGLKIGSYRNRILDNQARSLLQ